MVDAASFDEANQAYKDGNYGYAIEQYEILAKEANSGELYYNLGNAYYKTGDIAKSVLHYEKALKLTPGEEDIQHNLKIANLMVIDKIEATPEFFLLTWWKDLTIKMTSNAWTIIFLALLWISILSFLAFAFLQAGGKKLLFFSGVAGTFLALIFLLMAITRHQSDIDTSKAIIQSSSVSVKSAPLNTGTDLFIIHEGLKVTILDNENEWLKIQLADSKEGWVAANVLETI